MLTKLPHTVLARRPLFLQPSFLALSTFILQEVTVMWTERRPEQIKLERCVTLLLGSVSSTLHGHIPAGCCAVQKQDAEQQAEHVKAACQCSTVCMNN
jgi:hypothetical protein